MEKLPSTCLGLSLGAPCISKVIGEEVEEKFHRRLCFFFFFFDLFDWQPRQFIKAKKKKKRSQGDSLTYTEVYKGRLKTSRRLLM